MRNIIQTLIILLIFTSCQSALKENERIIEKYPNGQAKVIVKFINDDTTSYINYSYYENGNLESKCKIINDFFRGERISYYENGNIKEIDSIKTDSCYYTKCCCSELSITRYYRNGKIKEYLQKKNNKINGFAFKYNKIGEKIEGFMKNGEKEGVWRTYDKSGRLKWFKTFKSGILEGPTEEYPNDSITIIGYYKNDFENGKWIKVNSNNDTLGITYYEDGKEK